ncbi:YfgM family protein [Caenimonas aquaedulcis]|uniref:Ancillary SecYEG translocon subunit n=1 Tax=Caenimonas aquaedulcis TaxID=2793270 RepID=A0A931H1L5_9BURK|nr:tetratricopeptide repeat protein [Caenimonas aquaedulcis]MBG9386819.1 tetratricopeptide repeat protein [Caenimonas aquaedulcis]
MANNLDLEEQEQLDELKHFWNEYGNLITWVVILVFGAIAAWTGWQRWQASQAAQAAALYDEVDRAAQAGDTERVQRAFADIKDKFGSTTYAQQAGLVAAKTLVEKGNTDGAKAALVWVADKSSDDGLQALAHLRLSAILMDAKAYDEASKQLAGEFPKDFEPLVADRRGDILSLQGKKAEAKAEYAKAYTGLDERNEYRRLVEFKLNALGVDAQKLAAPAATAASGGAKP